jgi:DNA-binding NtrC family response regulator
MTKPSVVVFESSATINASICESLASAGISARSSASEAATLAHTPERGLVILGPSVVKLDTIVELAQFIRKPAPHVALLLLTSTSSEELAIAAIRAHVNDYVKFPCAPGELARTVRHHLDGADNPRSWSGCLSPSRNDCCNIVGDSPAMREVRERIRRMAASSTNILITGETGTGKELIAEQIHSRSSRRHKPLVTVNCAAIPDSLLESELFGYEPGAFTGAMSRCEGKVKAADGGSIFLDEIGELSLYGQAKLLRLIDGKEIQRLGRNGGLAVDVRVLAATNQDLEVMLEQGTFRKDLFFRLNVSRIHVPPLRERKDDLPQLVDHYIRVLNGQFGRSVSGLAAETMEALQAYEWPGNVRELKNILEAVFVELTPDAEHNPQLPPLFRLRCEQLAATSGNERERLMRALSTTNWNKTKAAEKLRWSRMTLYRKMAHYNIS